MKWLKKLNDFYWPSKNITMEAFLVIHCIGSAWIAKSDTYKHTRNFFHYIGLKDTLFSCVLRGIFTFGSGWTFVLGLFCQKVWTIWRKSDTIWRKWYLLAKPHTIWQKWNHLAKPPYNLAKPYTIWQKSVVSPNCIGFCRKV